jgi:hypothetical protein
MDFLSEPFHRDSALWSGANVPSGGDHGPDGGGFNPGYRVAKDPSHPGLERDYRRTLHTLEMLAPDIWLVITPSGSTSRASGSARRPRV